MRPMSTDARALFATGTLKSHQVVTFCQVSLGGVPLATPSILGGSVDVDASASSLTRRRMKVDIVATDDLIPRHETDLLYPGRAHVHLWRGIQWGDGRPGSCPGLGDVPLGVEAWPLGVFLLLGTTVRHDDKGIQLSLTGGDLSKRVERAGWETPYVIAAGADAATVWAAIVADRYPDALIDTSSAPAGVLSAQVLGDRPEANPWEDCVKIGQTIGCESYVDPEGVFILRPLETAQTGSVDAEYVAGQSGRQLGFERRLDAEKGYSVAIVEANPLAGGSPLRGTAEDSDPSSATYVDGDYGRVPLFIGDSPAQTQAQIDTEAAYVAARHQAADDGLSLDMVTNPAHEEHDIIHASDPAISVDGLFTLDAFSVPLDATSTMRSTVRRVAGGLA